MRFFLREEQPRVDRTNLSAHGDTIVTFFQIKKLFHKKCFKILKWSLILYESSKKPTVMWLKMIRHLFKKRRRKSIKIVLTMTFSCSFTWYLFYEETLTHFIMPETFLCELCIPTDCANMEIINLGFPDLHLQLKGISHWFSESDILIMYMKQFVYYKLCFLEARSTHSMKNDIM